MSKRFPAVLLIIIGGVLLLAATGLVGYNLYDDARAARAAAAVLAEMQTVPSTGSDENREMPVYEVDGKRYIGKIAVPSLGIELPVMEKWSYQNLKTAPCRYEGTAYRPGFVLCAHNYTRHFGRLKNLKKGDAVKFTAADGEVFDYSVEKVETLKPVAVSEMKSDNWDLTLFTCTLNGRTRVTVRCVKAEPAGGE